MSPDAGRYVVLRQIGENEWRLLGEIDRRPGLPARRSRAQAVRDVLGRDPRRGEAFVVLPRSEWRVASDVQEG
jgi:hypothetical protein